MSSLLEQNVVQVGDIAIGTAGTGLTEFNYDLFDVPGNIPSRIESVTMVVIYPDSTDISDVYEIQLVAQNGNILDRQTTPVIGSGETINAAYLTWVRRGNDLAQSGTFQFSSGIAPNGAVWWRGALPDFVLQQQGSVVLNVYRGTDGSYKPATATNIILSYTPAENGGTGTEIVLNTQPILVAGPS